MHTHTHTGTMTRVHTNAGYSQTYIHTDVTLEKSQRNAYAEHNICLAFKHGYIKNINKLTDILAYAPTHTYTLHTVGHDYFYLNSKQF